MWLRQEPSENGSLEGDVCSHLSRLLLMMPSSSTIVLRNIVGKFIESMCVCLGSFLGVDGVSEKGLS